jgi:hypothetical protein
MEPGRAWAIVVRMLAFAGVALVTGIGPVRADAIDGQWCLGTRSFEINGLTIRTPGGHEISGNYDRHGYTSIVPPNEEGAGTEVVMVLLNEATVRVTRGTSAPETWKRCKPRELSASGPSASAVGGLSQAASRS